MQQYRRSKLFEFRLWALSTPEGLNTNNRYEATSNDDRKHLSDLSDELLTMPTTRHQIWALRENPDSIFEEYVNSSELLSRGWVYQEVLLTPANLFCTKDEIWWSCSCATCSRTTPTGVVKNPSKGPSYLRAKYGCVPFVDDIRKRKTIITGDLLRLDPIRSWGDVLHSYCRTSITVDDDRLVAIAGIANLFRSLFPHQLQKAIYNSGLWSTNILQQLRWTATPPPLHEEDEVEAIQGRLRPARIHIPSWSPLNCAGIMNRTYQVDSVCNSHPLPLPIEVVAMGNAKVDRFGRATEQAGSTLHLRGVQPVEVNLAEDLNHAESKGCMGVPVLVAWDTKEERELARLRLSTEVGSYRALLFTFDPRRLAFLDGLLLRPGTLCDGLDRWIRCAYIFASFHPDYIGRYDELVTKYVHAYRVVEYGYTWVVADTAEEGRTSISQESNWQRESTGRAPELRDIYIV